mmetsp:Transcript_89578/g.109622  ORF Transcript_89578/g.109622 Transcript_89578/m.109622 type:complete len:117 (+) Transcript_89578:52-402(+)
MKLIAFILLSLIMTNIIGKYIDSDINTNEDDNILPILKQSIQVALKKKFIKKGFAQDFLLDDKNDYISQHDFMELVKKYRVSNSLKQKIFKNRNITLLADANASNDTCPADEVFNT